MFSKKQLNLVRIVTTFYLFMFAFATVFRCFFALKYKGLIQYFSTVNC